MAAPDPTRPRRGFARRLLDIRDWRVRTKLVAVLVIPAVAFLTLAGVGVASLWGDAEAYSADTDTAELSRSATALVHEIQKERDLTAGYIVKQDPPLKNELFEQRKSVDRVSIVYMRAELKHDDAGDDSLRATLDRVDDDLAALPRLRYAVDRDAVTQAAAFDEYSGYVSHLLDISLEIGEHGAGELNDPVRSLDAYSRAKELTSQVRGSLYALGREPKFSHEHYQRLTGTVSRRDAGVERFDSTSTPEQRSMESERVGGQALLQVTQMEESALREGARGDLTINPESWRKASTTQLEQMRGVETAMLDDVVAASGDLSDSAMWETGAALLGVLAILAISTLLSLGIARSMVRELRRLRGGAIDVAEHRLPAAIDRLRRPEAASEPVPPVEPLHVGSHDEIGQVAAAFDMVHQQAVRLATEQAVLRSSVNAMFVNFSRRSQSLVERQLRLIDDLEAREQDPDVLDNLFRLDHLATRMRRNNESLLVVAGSETTRRWTSPVPLSDVVLAAVSEIEHFTRINHNADTSMSIAGHAVSDLVHLLAELLENATRFSPPTTTVTLSGRTVRAGSEAVVEIEDMGIGMNAAALAEANRRLVDAPVIDVLRSQRMGLFVVSRLARRYGITVTLHESARGGLAARVWLPSTLVESRARAKNGDGSSASGVTGARPVLPAPALPAPEPKPEPEPPAPEPQPEPDVAEPPVADKPGEPSEPDGSAEEAPALPPAPVAPQPVRGPSSPPARTPEPFARTPEPFARAPESSPLLPDLDHEPFASEVDDLLSLDDTPTLSLPVFDSVSEWFRGRPQPEHRPAHDTPGERLRQRRPAPRASLSDQPPRPQPARAPETPPAAQRQGRWASKNDEGWAAAEVAQQPVNAGVTATGLPIRRPMAHFVPGSADTPKQPQTGAGRTGETGQPARASDKPVSPEHVRGLLSDYYRGVRRAREGEPSGPGSGKPTTTPPGEPQTRPEPSRRPGEDERDRDPGPIDRPGITDDQDTTISEERT